MMPTYFMTPMETFTQRLWSLDFDDVEEELVIYLGGVQICSIFVRGQFMELQIIVCKEDL